MLQGALFGGLKIFHLLASKNFEAAIGIKFPMVLTVVGVLSPPSQACPTIERGPVPVEEGGRPLHVYLVERAG